LRIGERLNFNLSRGAECDRAMLELGQGGPGLLMWLFDARANIERTSLSAEHENEIVYEPCGDTSVSLSAETGFIQRVVREGKDGLRTTLSLASVDLDARPSREDLKAPAAEAGATDLTSEHMHMAFRQALQWSRAGLFSLVARMLEDGRLEWSDEVREKLAEIVRQMHTDDVRGLFEFFTGPEHGWIDEMAEWARAALAEMKADDRDAREQLAAQIAQCRAELEERCADEGKHLLELPFPEGSCKARPSLYEDLTALGKRLLPEVYTEVVTTPLLARFDEKVAKQLEAK